MSVSKEASKSEMSQITVSQRGGGGRSSNFVFVFLYIGGFMPETLAFAFGNTVNTVLQ